MKIFFVGVTILTLFIYSQQVFFLSAGEQDPDYLFSSDEMDVSEESENESDWEDACALSTEKKYASDERMFMIYESKLKELLKYCPRCGSLVNQGLMQESKNTGSQLTLHIQCMKGESIFPKLYIFYKILQIFTIHVKTDLKKSNFRVVIKVHGLSFLL